MKRLGVAFFLLGVIFTFTGCAELKKDKGVSGTAAMLEPQAITKFSDVPVPAGFKLIPANTYCFEASGLRMGLLKYEGKADVEAVVNFYKEQMPMSNWRLLNVVEYGERLLNFDREQETCIVTLLSKGHNVTITISLGPKAQTPKKQIK